MCVLIFDVFLCLIYLIDISKIMLSVRGELPSIASWQSGSSLSRPSSTCDDGAIVYSLAVDHRFVNSS